MEIVPDGAITVSNIFISQFFPSQEIHMKYHLHHKTSGKRRILSGTLGTK